MRTRNTQAAFLCALVALCLTFTASLQAQITDLALFNGGSTGAFPLGGLTLSQDGSTLYGTTSVSGLQGGGVVYSLPVGGGTPTVLANFNSTSGEEPRDSLTLIGSTLYGTTSGASGTVFGTVFSLPVGGGTPTVLASFTGANGANPYGSLTLIGSTLYGTTYDGGANNYGAVFSVPVGGGAPTVLASFNQANGETPNGDLTLSEDGSTFYGTAQIGPRGTGEVFSLPVSGGTPTVLASLSFPTGGLTLIGNTLYGVTRGGGSTDGGDIFSLPTSGGTPTVLASFPGGPGDPSNEDPEEPQGSLTLSQDGSTFYGITQNGVTGSGNFGTVYAVPVTPAPEPGSVGLLLTGLFLVTTRRAREVM